MAKNIQRLYYHTGLFLEQQEFELEQNYHLLMRRRLNYGLFKPGVLFGLALDYNSGILRVTTGMAIDEFTDTDSLSPSYGEILGREIVLLENSPPVDLSGFPTAGTNVWITIRHDFQPTDPKQPTNITSRITETPKIETHTADPGQGTSNILLGMIVIGTDSHTEAVQKAVLKLGGGAVAPPLITSFNPASGGVGTIVTITGNNFTGATAVSFGGVAATAITVNLATQITATVPIGAVTGRIRVTTPSGFGESTTNFIVSVPLPAPTISSFTPANGGVGTIVAITGSNFTGATAVSFGGVSTTTIVVNSATQITATVPTSAVTGQISVTTPAGSGASATNFQVTPAPTLDGPNPFTPRSGFDNQPNPITIRGQNFNVDSPSKPRVYFGNFQVQAPSVLTFTANIITVRVPNTGVSNQQVPIRVITTGGEVNSGNLTPPVLFTLNP